MIVLVILICACAAIAAYAILRITEWFEKKLTKNSRLGK